MESVRFWRAFTTTQIGGSDNTYEFVWLAPTAPEDTSTRAAMSTKGCTALGNPAAPFGEPLIASVPAWATEITLAVT